MLFWCLTNLHRCTFGFPIPFIDVLLGFCEGPSMYFWVSVKVHRCSFGSLWSFIDVVFISFSLNMIDAPLVSNLSLRHSSMLFGIFSPHLAFIDAPRLSVASLNMPSMYLEARGALMNWFWGCQSCEIALMNWFRRCQSCGIQNVDSELKNTMWGLLCALMSNTKIYIFINVSWGSRCIDS